MHGASGDDRPGPLAARTTRYQDTAQRALGQARILSGTPGTLKQRVQSGKRYWVREYIRPDGAKVDDYIGAAASVSEEQMGALRAEIELARSLASDSGTLRLLGFQRIDRTPAAVLAVLFNHGLPQAGLALVGSHAYGVLLNELGIATAAYRTQDLDLARGKPLTVVLPDDLSFEDLLHETRLQFTPVPALSPGRPSGSFKLPGAQSLIVDLLAPAPEIGKVVEVPELRAHAQAIPHLRFLIEDAIAAVVLSPNQVIPVRIPSPERFVLHKLLASQSRRTAPGKASRDRLQAAIVAAALEEEMPGRLLEAWKEFPRGGRTAVRSAAGAAAKLLSPQHPGGEALLLAVAG